MNDKKEITIVEIGPRDGFQNIKEFIPTAVKIAAVEKLIDAGIKRIQLTSFVSPLAIPQLRDSAEVTKYFLKKYGQTDDLEFFALTSNLKGVENARKSGLSEVAYVASVSLSHNLANINRSVDASFEELSKIREAFPDLKITFDVATAFGCPFEGITPVEKTVAFVRRGINLGVERFNLCDTIGIGDPVQVRTLVTLLQKEFPMAIFDVHIHDTRNMGMVNSLAAVECGIKRVQTTAGGLGGCPFAPGASGNTATEDFVYMLERMGYDTGISFEKLLETARWLQENIDGNFSGHHINIPPNVVNK